MVTVLLLEGKKFKYIKAGMYTLNAFVALLGIALSAVGIWIRTDFDTFKYRDVMEPVLELCSKLDKGYDYTVDGHMDAIAYFLIFLGVSILVTAWLGVCGTLRERQGILAMFSMLLFIVFSILFAAGLQAILSIGAFKTCEDNLVYNLTRRIKNYDKTDKDKRFVDLLQSKMFCCGVTGTNDTCIQELPKEMTTTEIPALPKPTCDVAIKTLFDAIEDNEVMIIIVSLVIGLFTLAGVGMSAYMFLSIRTKLEEKP